MRELGHKDGWAPKNWRFQTVVLEKTPESPLSCKEIQPVHPKGNQFWILIGRTDTEAEAPILWPPDVKNWLTRKDHDAGNVWKAGEGDDRGGDSWMTSPTRWTWVWASSGNWWWTCCSPSRQSWHAAVHAVERSQTQLSDWTDWIKLIPRTHFLGESGEQLQKQV